MASADAPTEYAVHPAPANPQAAVAGAKAAAAAGIPVVLVGDETVLRAEVTTRVQPGVVYTTFHFPESGANVVTTDNSDWATNCPEYKVTAVQVVRVNQPANWQQRQADAAQARIRRKPDATPA